MTGPGRSLRIAFAAALAGYAGAQDANVVERIGKRYRIEFRAGNLDAPLAGTIVECALAEIEGAFATWKKLLGAKDQKPTSIVLYRDGSEFRTAERASRWPFTVGGFVDDDGRGQVLLSPELASPVLAKLPLPPVTREELLRVAAEIAVRQVIADNGTVDVEDWLRWVLTMGALEAVTVPKRECGVDAAYDLRRWRLWSRLANNGVLSLDQLTNFDLRPTDRNGLESLFAYAAVAADQYANANPNWARKMAAKLKPPKAIVDKFYYRDAAVAAALGSAAGKADVAFTKYQRALAPQWEMRGPTWGRVGDRIVVAAGKDAASMVSCEPPPPGDYAILCRLEIGPGEGSERFVMTGQGNTVLAVLCRDEVIEVSVWDTQKERWSDKQAYRPPAPLSAPFGLRIEVTAAVLRVLIEGEQRLEWQHGGMDLHTEWAVEANDRIAWFENLRCEPLAPAKK